MWWRDEGLGGSGDEVMTPFMTHTIKLPMRQHISGFWDSLPRLVSFLFTTFLCFLAPVCFFGFSHHADQWRFLAGSTQQHITLCLSILFHCGLMNQTQNTHSTGHL